MDETEYKFILIVPKNVYGGMRTVFNSKKEAQKYMEDNIGSEAWHQVKIKKMEVDSFYDGAFNMGYDDGR